MPLSLSLFWRNQTISSLSLLFHAILTWNSVLAVTPSHGQSLQVINQKALLCAISYRLCTRPISRFSESQNGQGLSISINPIANYLTVYSPGYWVFLILQEQQQLARWCWFGLIDYITHDIITTIINAKIDIIIASSFFISSSVISDRGKQT